MTTKSSLALLAFLAVSAAQMFSQGTGTVVPPQPNEEAKQDAWSFAAAAYGYVVPDDQSYFSGTFRADRNWAHTLQGIHPCVELDSLGMMSHIGTVS